MGVCKFFFHRETLQRLVEIGFDTPGGLWYVLKEITTNLQEVFMQINEREVNGVTVLEIHGKILMGEGDIAIKKKVDELLAENVKNVVLDLADVPYIDSSGLGELIRCYTTMRKASGTLKLANVTERIVDLLTITKLITVFEYYKSVDDAVKSYK
jgi:anti-sigma B factor antagonist